MADLVAMRRDPAAFAVAVYPHRLEGWQLEELRATPVPGQISAWCWSRQISKSTELALLALWVGFRSPGRRVLILSGGGDLGARRLLAEARRLAAGSSLLAASIDDESGSVLTLSNGSELRAVSGLSENAIRGWTVDALLIDEAQLLPASAMAAALPTILARPAAWVVVAGTAGRSEGDFYDLFRSGEVGAEGIRSSRKVSNLIAPADPDAVSTPWWSATAAERLRVALGPVRAAAELECRWASGADRLFSAAELDLVTADFEADTLAGLRGPASVLAGLDLGISHDRSAFVALGGMALDEGAPRVLAVRCAHAWAPRTPVLAPGGGVFADVAASPAVMQLLRVDATGMQAALVPSLVAMLRARRPELGGGRPLPPIAVVEEDGERKPVRFSPDELDGLPPSAAERIRRYHDRAAAGRGSAVRHRQPAVPRTDVRGLAFSSAMKAAGYGALKSLVERRALLLPASATELRSELLLLEVGLTRTGAETFEAAGAGHDDLCDALVLSLIPYKNRRGVWRTGAMNVVEGVGMPRPALPAGAWSAGAVETGGGLRMPRRPVWCNPAGSAMTVPDEVAEWAPKPDPRMAELARALRPVLSRHDDEEIAR